MADSLGKTTVAELIANLEALARQSVTARFADLARHLLHAIQANPSDSEGILAQALQQQFEAGERQQRDLDLMFYGSTVQRVTMPGRICCGNYVKPGGRCPACLDGED